jgi:serpin B
LLRGLDSRVDFRIANSIWHEQSFPVEPAFLQTTSDFFDAEVAARDFNDPTTLEAVNAWVNTATAGKIERILDEIPADAVMYLINAIYFNGDWTTSFDPKHTEPQPFAGIAGSTTVPLMHKSDSVAFTEANGVQAVELPYARGAFAMTVVLPPEGSDINDFVASMSQASWDALHAAMAPRQVLVWLPKFTLERDYELKQALNGLGIHLAFGGGDFSPLSSTMGDRLEVSEVKHKTFVDVHEEGTEAAAVTSVGIVLVCACGPTLPVFRADRPFVFAIRERNSGTILFMGKIARM